VFACGIAIAGIGVFALPACLLGASFLEEVQPSKQSEAMEYTCTQCGKAVGIDSGKNKKRSA